MLEDGRVERADFIERREPVEAARSSFRVAGDVYEAVGLYRLRVLLSVCCVGVVVYAGIFEVDIQMQNFFACIPIIYA